MRLTHRWRRCLHDGAVTELGDVPINEAHRSAWAGASTLLELGELMARWIEGSLSYQPGYFGTGPDDETAELVPLLARVNRAGFFTDFSQPGVLSAGEYGQRAAASGFCAEQMMLELVGVGLASELVVLRFPPGSEGVGQIAVTIDDGAECTWVGSPMDPAEIDHAYGADLPSEGLAALHDAWQINVLDPRWGRRDLLMQALKLIGRAAHT